MAYNSLIEKAQSRERERQRDDARRLRKVEQNFVELLASVGFIEPSTSWEFVRERLGDHPAFKVSCSKYKLLFIKIGIV